MTDAVIKLQFVDPIESDVEAIGNILSKNEFCFEFMFRLFLFLAATFVVNAANDGSDVPAFGGCFCSYSA